LRNVADLEGRGVEVLGALDGGAAVAKAALATVALAWLKAQPAIAAPIASATSRDQLDQLTAAMSLDLTAEQIERLDRASAAEPAES
jgi:aryl-alcohol dehydrogenase-like predicted oxidoreductase